MIVTNRERTTAIVIRHDGQTASLVPMRGGKLRVMHIPHYTFVAEWKESGYSLPNALAKFLRHASREGASQEAIRGLQKLEKRDRWVVAPLF